MVQQFLAQKRVNANIGPMGVSGSYGRVGQVIQADANALGQAAAKPA